MQKERLQQALKKIAQYLSVRSHSKKELKQKLSKKFSADIIEKSLELAEQKNWLEEPLELSQKIAGQLNRKNKSWLYIKAYLKNRELPLPPYNKEEELEKAERLLKKTLQNSSKKDSLQIQRFLVNRLFEINIIETVLEKLALKPDTHG